MNDVPDIGKKWRTSMADFSRWPVLYGRRQTIDAKTRPERFGSRLRRAAQLLLCTAVLMLSVATARGEEPTEQRYDFSIPQAAVADALAAFARQTGTLLLFPYDLVEGRRANAVAGRFTARQALALLLQGTGLSAAITDRHVVTLEADNKAETSMTLGSPKKTLFSAIAAGLASLFTAPGAGAQADAPRAIEEMIVTAQKREQNLQEAPLSISAFSADQLDAAGAFDIRDVGGMAPNVTLLDAAASNSTMAVTVRGVQSQEPSLAMDSKIGLYIDGVYYARLTGALFDVADLERIEVLRGPQGTLWGRNTTGGAINAITKRPSGEFGFEQKLSVGNYGYYRSSTSVDAPKFFDVSAKLTYLKTARDGVVDNTYVGASKELGDDNAEAFRAALSWQPAGLEALTVDYAYDRYDLDAAPRAFQLTSVNRAMAASPTAFIAGRGLVVNPYYTAAQGASRHPSDTVHLDFALDERTRLSGHALTVSWEFENAELKSISAWRDYERKVDGSDFDGGAHVVPLFHSANDESQEQFSQELQLVGDLLESRLEYVVGLYYFEEQAKSRTPQTTSIIAGALPDGTPILRTFSSTLSYTTDNDSWAVYSQFSYKPEFAADRLTLTLGARYTEDNKAAALISANTAADQSWSNFNPSFTAGYAFSDSINGYATISTGYNSGAFNVRAATAESFGNPPDEEEVVNYEVGVKSDFLDGRLRLNGAVFLMDYTDMQVTQFQASAAGATSVLTNAGKAQIRGGELELLAMLIPNFTVSATWGYTDMEYKEFVTSVNQLTGVAVDRADEARQVAPKNTGSLGLEYELPGWRIGRLTGRLDVAYSDKLHSDPFASSASDTEEHTTVNARLSLREVPLWGGEFSAALWGKNLTDDVYRLRGIDFGQLGFIGGSYGDPKMWGVDFGWRY